MIKDFDHEQSSTSSPRDRLSALPAERRAQLLDPAEAEFAAHGFEAASLSRILVAAKMSKGQAYYYISSKGDLYRAVIERGLAKLATAIDTDFPEPATPAEFWHRVAELFAHITTELQKDAVLAALARGIYDGPGSQAALAEPLARIRAQSDRLMTIGQAVGAVRTDLPQSLLADVLFSTVREIDRWFAEHWDDLDGAEALELNAKAVGIIVAIATPTS